MTQWTHFSSDYSAILDLDIIDGHYEGRFTGQGRVRLVEVAFIRTTDLSVVHELEVQLTAVEPGTGRPLTEAEIAEIYPNGYQAVIPVKLEFGEKYLDVWLNYEAGRQQQFRLDNFDHTKGSALQTVRDVTSWDEFMKYCSGLPERRFVFRGQSAPAKLRTSFHRTNRSDLYRYTSGDVKFAYRALSGKTRHVFKSADPDENAAFLNLLQHHGFPTPLLDWSESPFIAAYFAFNRARSNAREGAIDCVRVLCFDRLAWERDWAVIPHLINVAPHVTLLYPHSMENPRAAPQQALSMVTNLDDIEGYIHTCESMRERRYLTAFDLPYAERGEVLKDLAMMGITQGTLFPGLDGLCEDLRDRFFGRR